LPLTVCLGYKQLKYLGEGAKSINKLLSALYSEIRNEEIILNSRIANCILYEVKFVFD